MDLLAGCGQREVLSTAGHRDGVRRVARAALLAMPVRLTSELRAQGLGAKEIRRLVRDQELISLRRGAYLTESVDGYQRHRELIRATIPVLADGAVISHVSAAVLHGLPLIAPSFARVTFTRPGKGGCFIGEQLHRYRTPLASGDAEVIEQIERTVPARTVVDLARCCPLPLAVAAADNALRRGVTRAQLHAQLEAAPRRRGLARARMVAEFADPRSESPGESYSRLVIWQLGLPAPDLQVEVWIGGVLYRSDFGWLEHQVLGEFDGKVKYGDLLREGETAADVVMREKRREADLRAAGWGMARWTWADLYQPDRLRHLITAELNRRR